MKELLKWFQDKGYNLESNKLWKNGVLGQFVVTKDTEKIEITKKVGRIYVLWSKGNHTWTACSWHKIGELQENLKNSPYVGLDHKASLQIKKQRDKLNDKNFG